MLGTLVGIFSRRAFRSVICSSLQRHAVYHAGVSCCTRRCAVVSFRMQVPDAVEEKNRFVEVIRNASAELSPIPTSTRVKLSMLDGVAVVLFDVYGTLFVSASGDVGTAKAQQDGDHFAEALSAVFGVEYNATIGAAARDSYFAAIEADHAAMRAVGVEHPEVDVVRIWERVLRQLKARTTVPEITTTRARRCALEYEVRANPVWPMPHALEVLKALGDFRTGIVSNAQFYTPLLFEALLGSTVEELGLSVCSWSYQVGEAKPSRRMFTGILEELRALCLPAPESVLYVGNDMLNDVWTAASVGCRTCLFAGDARSLRWREDRPECRGLTPDLVITDFRQLLHCIPRGKE